MFAFCRVDRRRFVKQCRMRLALLVVLLGCTTTSPPGDVVGPFTGPAHRFVIDTITLPTNNKSIDQLADDLDGDGSPDNRAGSTIAVLFSLDDATTHGADMIASGALASEIEIVSDDLVTDDTVAVLYHGAPGDTPVPVGGRLSETGFAPNLTRQTRVPGEAVLRLPIFADADPVSVHVVGLEIELTRDGRGGFDGLVAGGIRNDDALDAVFAGVVQMIAANPQDHLVLAGTTDLDHDAILTREEIAHAPLIAALLAPDIQLFDGDRFAPRPPGAHTTPDALSIGFAIHLTPCDSGRCAAATAFDRCHDRLRDGDETDADCGGSCGRCPALAACVAPGDCQTGACDAGQCRAPSCSDGRRDGLETDTDCGSNCPGCLSGRHCITSSDCASGRCTSSFGGTCL
jgi:hypothetical protein